MKYLKLFEDYYYNSPKYNVGDWVETKRTTIMIITDIDTVARRGEKAQNDVYQYEGVLYNNADEFLYIIEEYIERKLTEEEIEIYKNTQKYNL